MNDKEKQLKFGANSTHDFVEEEAETPTLWERITKKRRNDNSPELTALPEKTAVNSPNIKPMQPSESKTAIPLTSPFASSFNTVTQETIITGDFVTESELKFNGTLRGELKSSNNLSIGGSVQGNVTGKDIQITGGAVKGNIDATGNVSLDGKSVTIGDIKAIDCFIDGRVKGSIVADGFVSLQNNAIVHGNITANNFDAQKGAVIKGHISIMCNDNRSDSETFALPVPKKTENVEKSGQTITEENSQTAENTDQND